MSDDNLRIIVLEQQTFIDKFEKLSPNLSKTLKEYITENNLSNPSSENYQKIFQHANGLSPDSASQAKGFCEIISNNLKNIPNVIKLPIGENLLNDIKNTCPEVLETASNQTDNIIKSITSKSPEILSTVQAAGQNLSHYLQQINPSLLESIFSNTASEVLQFIGTGLSTVISAVPGEAILHVAGALASAFPFLYPLHILLSSIGTAITQAKYNRESANALLERCLETEKVLQELAPTLSDLVKTDTDILKPLEGILQECLEFLKKFTSKGFLSGLWQGFKNTVGYSNDEHRLSLFDKRIVGAIQNLSLRINNKQIQLQVASSEKMDQIFVLVNDKCKGKQNIEEIKPEDMIEIAKSAGCQSNEEITNELEGVGYKLEKILSTLENMNKKLDVVAETVDLSRNEMSEYHIAQMKGIEEIKQITGAAVKKQFSNRNDLNFLAKKWASTRFPNPQRLHIHADGIGERNIRNYDGKSGIIPSKIQTTSTKPARNGYDGKNGQDGEDGDDGEDGHDGSDGHDGEDGEDSNNFEVRIECIDKSRSGFRTYRIEYSGRAGKHSETVELSYPTAIIDINGRGGKGGDGGSGQNGQNGFPGGRGGRGGNGINKQDGGSGGHGGMGGTGGIGGVGGHGGKGGNGAEVIIHTNDPTVLMLIDIDVSGGKGGVSGSHGQSGEGGEGGDGGEGGNPGTYLADVIKVGNNGMAITTQETVSERPGRRGKKGKRGKSGKPQKAKPAKPGRDGESGKVSFCIFNSETLVESAGIPYHLMLPKKLSKTLTPIFFYDQLISEPSHPQALFFYYGGLLKYGPLSPVNIGGLTCPPSEMKGSIKLLSNLALMSNNIISKHEVTFPQIPPSSFSSYGELSSTYDKTLTLTIPDLSNECYVQPNYDVHKWPWNNEAYILSPNYGIFEIQLSVEDVPFTGTFEDGEMVSSKSFNMVIDHPIKFIKTKDDNVLQIPTHIWPTDSQQYEINFGLTNKLFNTQLTSDKLAKYKCILRVAGYQFRPNITNSTITNTTIHPKEPIHQEFLLNSYEIPLPTIDPSGKNRFVFNLQLPTSNNNNNNNNEINEVNIGSHIYFRIELTYDSKVIETSRPAITRIIPPPLNLIQLNEINYKDILIFCNIQMTVEDYKLLKRFTLLLGYRVHFIDCQYGNHGTINISTWEKFKGKATIIWLPNESNLNNIPNIDLQTHLECGGTLICSIKSTFRWNKNNSFPPEKATRRCIMVPETFKLNNLLPSESIVEINGNSNNNGNGNGNNRIKKIQGNILPFIAINLIASMPTQEKLKYYLSNRNECEIIIGDTIIDNYTVIPPSCGCLPCFSTKQKILPLESSPFILRDCLFTSIRTDIEIDLQFYNKHGNNNLCYAIQEVLLFSNNLSSSSNEYASYIYSILESSNILNEEHNTTNSNHIKNWKLLKNEINKIKQKLFQMSKTCSVNPISYAQRLSGIDILKNTSTTTVRQFHLNDKSVYAFAMNGRS